jgi:hypothetical protein
MHEKGQAAAVAESFDNLAVTLPGYWRILIILCAARFPAKRLNIVGNL